MKEKTRKSEQLQWRINVPESVKTDAFINKQPINIGSGHNWIHLTVHVREIVFMILNVFVYEQWFYCKIATTCRSNTETVWNAYSLPSFTLSNNFTELLNKFQLMCFFFLLLYQHRSVDDSLVHSRCVTTS